jgi:hypothetical protein
LKTVAECSSGDEARLLQSLLASFGLTAYLPDELSMAYPPSVSSVRVQVADGDAESARSIIAGRSG